MSDDDVTPARVRWARLRHAIIAPLLASPPEPGDLAARIAELAARPWRHPANGESVRFAFKTIERWFYTARHVPDPMKALERRVPKHAGTHPSISSALADAIRAQHAKHPRWSYQLHHDNLVALAREQPALGPPPGYATVCRFMKEQGLSRLKRYRRRGAVEPAEPFELREVRSYEVTHVHGLWHWDFHECSRSIVLPSGERTRPQLLGILDDCSRVACHVQWYLRETTEVHAHGMEQAILKRGLPRRGLSDCGSAMLAAEMREGLARLGIDQHTTLPYCPEQNAKQEVFWAQVEGRLMAMLEGERELSLDLLNRATQAWVEQEYHRKPHRELGVSPLERYLAGPSAGRPSPSLEDLRRAFRTEVRRRQRKSDGTVTVEGVRFEIPSAYRTLTSVHVRVARWDLSSIEMVDPRTGVRLATLLPLDKAAHADGRRRRIGTVADRDSNARPAPSGIAPHLRRLMADYAATGLPPGYLTHDEPDPSESEEKHDP